MKAVIDLGTNTFHVLIAHVQGNELQVIFKQQIPVKIGKGGIHKSQLTPESMLRAFDALAEIEKQLEFYHVTSVIAIATAAIRDAENGQFFIDEVKRRFGFTITRISGEEEAQFIQMGVQATLQKSVHSYLVMDIGGGSVEFIAVVHQRVVWKKSYRMGVSRLLHSYQLTDPLSADDVTILTRLFDEQFSEITQIAYRHQLTTLVGAAGSFESLKDIMEQDLCVSLSPQHLGLSTQLPLYSTLDCLKMLIHSDASTRKMLNGLVPFRQEMIALASLMTLWVIQKCQTESLFVSSYALKEGVLLSGSK